MEISKTQGGILVLAGVVVLGIIIAVSVSSGKGELVMVKAKEGSIVGLVRNETGIFWGIPYSKPPIDILRWRRPRDPSRYTEPYWNATYKRPGCKQVCDQPAPEYICPLKTSEDCLYLNVFVPKRLLIGSGAKSPLNENHFEIDPSYLPGGGKTPLPVMIWFHGGNFLNGAGSAIFYDGRYMAQKGNVIVVTINYRLAYLGFLLQGTQGEESQGNFGFWDQVKAMEWVQNNIAMFGGNHNLVTLFGQNAGAESIAIHLTSYLSGHLFHQAIMQSNPFAIPLQSQSRAKEFGDRFATNANCAPDEMTCLRSKSVQELERAYNRTFGLNSPDDVYFFFYQPWGPVIDNDVVPDLPLKRFAQNTVQNKPMLMGATVDEAVIYAARVFPNPINNTLYTRSLRIIFKNRFQEVLNVFPPTCDGSTVICDNRNVLAHLVSEFLFECPQRRAINYRSNSYLYSFNQAWSFNEMWGIPLCFERVCQGSELAYAFGVENLTFITYTEEERELSERMIRYWTNFAHQGDPNDDLSPDLLEWPSFSSGSGQNDYRAMELKGAGDTVLLNPYRQNCNFWDEFDGYGDF